MFAAAPSPPPPSPLTIVPTPYPADPVAPLPIEDYVRVDLASPEFKALNAKLDGIIGELQRSNVIAGEVRDRLSAELRAAQTLLAAPKPNRNLIELLLVKSLKYLASLPGQIIIGMLAEEALRALAQILSQPPNIPL